MCCAVLCAVLDVLGVMWGSVGGECLPPYSLCEGRRGVGHIVL